MMLITWQTIAGQPMNAQLAFWGVMRRLPGLTQLGSYHVAVHIILLAPFAILGTIVYRLVFSSMRVYFLFLESTATRYIGIAAAVLLAAVIIVIHGAVYLHWAFSLPALLVDNLSAASALTYIHGLLRGTRRRIGIVVFFLWMLTLLFPLALGRGFYSVGGIIFTRLPKEHRLVIPVVIILMTAYVASSFLGEFLAVAVNSLTITHLYTGLRENKGAAKQDGKHFRIIGYPQDAEEEKEQRFSHGATKPHVPHLSHNLSPRQIVAFMVIAVILSIAAAATIIGDFNLHDNVQITAHRGSSFSVPENTLAAIRNAIEEGADYAEIDVRLTADDRVVLLHDRDLFRVAGVKKNLSALTYEQIRSLDVGSWFSPRFRDERIPLLSNVVAFSKGRIKLSIELKIHESPQRLVGEVLKILYEHDSVSECYICSSNIEALKYIRNLDPSIRIGCIVSQSMGQVTFLDVDFLSVSSLLITPGLIDAAHAAGKDVHVWTVNKPQQMVRFIDLGVDNLITDVPPVARTLLDQRAAMSKQELLFTKVRSWFLR